MPVLDSHTHLDIVGTDPSGQIEAAVAVGVDRIVQVGVDVESSQWSVRLAQEYPGVLAAVALHPNDAPRIAARGPSPGPKRATLPSGSCTSSAPCRSSRRSRRITRAAAGAGEGSAAGCGAYSVLLFMIARQAAWAVAAWQRTARA